MRVIESLLGAVKLNAGNAGGKTWLETHIWHAKRMRMGNLWGYRLVSSLLFDSRTTSLIAPPPRLYIQQKRHSVLHIGLLFTGPSFMMYPIIRRLN